MEHNELSIAAVDSALAEGSFLKRISEKYSVFNDVLQEYLPQLQAAEKELCLSASELKHSLDRGQPDGLISGTPNLAEQFRQNRCTYSKLLSECAKRLRQRVNTPDECLRLARCGDGRAMSGQSFVYFKNGTSVTVWEDELTDGESVEEAARRKLADCPKAWVNYPDEYESEGTNAFSDSQWMCSVSSEQGSMNGLTFWYWASEEWPAADSEIACLYRQKDCEEQAIASVVRGDVT